MPPQHSFPQGSPHSFSFSADSTLGALLVGVLLSYVLFGVTTTQTYLYSGRFPNDSRKTKLLVTCVWFLELGHVICIGHTLYTMVVTDFGHPERLTTIPQSLVQGFFSYRIYRLWKRLYIPLLTWALSFLFLGATSAVFVIGLQSMPFPVFEKQWGFLLNTLWAVAAANDLIIASTLVFWLVRKREDSEQMTPVVDKVIGWTIETGVITRRVLYFSSVFGDCHLTLHQCGRNPEPRMLCDDEEQLHLDRLNTTHQTLIVFYFSLNSRGTLRTMTQKSISKPYPLFSVSLSTILDCEIDWPLIFGFDEQSNLSVNNEMPDPFLSMRTPRSEMSRTVSVDSGNPYMIR
ncbi:hypothetical protein MVEN_01566700 [Mycena venus]|uniref:DUF6534 domain-containing protein n=1 Tax=Mycena venus TaxID=2733690 RepID=A0A8H6XPC3_9AGAR|nr:hypothetical protein MVEN_01566700 [Mycena venus]